MSRSEPDLPLSLDDFGALFAGFRTSAFRLETRSTYIVGEEEDVLRAYGRGDGPPASFQTRPWLQTIADATQSGKSFSRVHAFSGPITPYLAFEVDWAYTSNAQAGDRIGILNVDRPQEAFAGLPYEDFWLFDNERVVVVDYDRAGRFTGAREVTDPHRINLYRRARDRALALAVPLEDFRLAHEGELAQRGRAGAAIDPL